MMLVSLLATGALAATPCTRLPSDEARFVIVGRNVPPPATGLMSLQYADDDARSMYGAAVSQFCFRPDQITLLIDDEASVTNVAQAFAAESSHHLGRLFVYISAHGSHAEGIQLDRSLPWDDVYDWIEAIDAQQTFVFLDTCDSATFGASRQGRVKGAVQIAPRLDEGRFFLTASTGRAFERHWLRGGVATRDFLSIIYGHGSPDEARVISSNDVCRILSQSPDLSGQCDQRIKGGEGVILVPDRRPPGWLQIDEANSAGRWSYVLDEVNGGVSFPIRIIDLGDSVARRSDGLPPGAYRLRRIHADRRWCDVAPVTISAGQTSTVSASSWTPEPRYCRWLEERESRVPARPTHAIGIGLGLATPWIDSTRVEFSARVDYQRTDVLGYRAAIGATIGWQPVDRAVEPGSHRLEALDIGLTGAWDAFFVRLSALDLYAGGEVAAGWSRVQRAEQDFEANGLSGFIGLRPGAAFRVTGGWLLDVRATVGLRAYRFHHSLTARPLAGLTVGGAIGLH